DIYVGTGLPSKQYDACFMLGVNYLFDDYEAWLRNLLSLTRKGGRIYVFGLFNPEPLDVRAMVSRAGAPDAVETPWNLISQRSISSYLQRIGRQHDFFDWSIQLDIPKKPDADPIRSWTVGLANGERMIVNGTQFWHHLSLLEIFA